MNPKPMMSDREARERSGGYGYHEALGELLPLEARLAEAEHKRAAFAEARAILVSGSGEEAHTTTPERIYCSVTQPRSEGAYFRLEYHDALADSLRDFVGAEDAADLGNRRGKIRSVVQHSIRVNEVKGIVGKRQGLRIGNQPAGREISQA